MWRIKTITGTTIESSRFTSKPMHWHERTVCNERRELWLANCHENERDFVIDTKLMPTKRTHCMRLGLAGSTLLASTRRPRVPARTTSARPRPIFGHAEAWS